jgi:Skp family chaperone for outer membrane proteins
MKHIGKILLAGLLVFTFALPPSARAAEAVSIAIVDVQRLIADSSAGKNIHEQLETRKASFLADLSKQEQTLRDEEKKLSDQKASLSQEEFAKKAKEFEKKLNETRKKAQDSKKSLEGSAVTALGKLRKEILNVVESVAKEKGYTIVLTSQSIVVAKDENDITAVVLEKLNTKISKITLEK